MTGVKMTSLKAIAFAFLLALGVVAVTAPATPAAAQQDNKDNDRRKSQSLDPSVAKDLLSAYEQMQNEKYQDALAELNKLMDRRGGSMKAFDKASVLQIRGTVYVNLENFPAAIKDFVAALDLNALPDNQAAQLRFNVAQLYFQQENYPAAIKYLTQWINETESPNADAYYLLSAAYYYQNNYRQARPNIEKALGLMTDPNKRYYDLANIIYSELNLTTPRLALLEKMIALWPSELSYWKQVAQIYSTQDGREKQAFSVLEVAYDAGLVSDESDIITLAQYYSLFNNAYRGAKLLEREMNAGAVEKNVKNLELLSQLWSQSREHEKAIPVLRAASKLSDTGTLSYRLGQVLLADEQSKPAETALEAAINKGGLSERDKADAWLLLGTARFNQAGPGDRAKRKEADDAFAQAQRYSTTRTRASQWRQYIKAINDTEDRAKRLEDEQKEQLEKAARDRLTVTCRAQKLSGAAQTAECLALEKANTAAENKDEATPDTTDNQPSGDGSDGETTDGGATE